MKRFGLALIIFMGLANLATAQTKFTMPPPAGVMVGGLQVVTTCGAASGLVAGNTAFAVMDTTGVLCTSAGGGGGGGLAVTDGATFTASTSTFTPVGGEYASAPTTCVDGKQCTAALTTNRELRTHDTDVLAAVQAAIPPGTNVIGRVGIDQTTPGTTNLVALAANQSVNTAQVNGVTTLTGTGATGTGAQRVTVSTDQATNAGAALVKGGVGTVNGGSDYETVAASQTAQALGATGATGDYLSHCVLQPTTTAAGTMTILDNATVIFTFTTGTLSNLAPIAIPIGAISVSGAWKVTTGANETATCFGKFT